jgi:hypothetical protein
MLMVYAMSKEIAIAERRGVISRTRLMDSISQDVEIP